MLGFLVVLRRSVRAFRRVRHNPETRSLPTVASAVLLTGTLFYWQVEGWIILDSLYSDSRPGQPA